MEEFFSTLLHSWGSDTPQEVYWALGDFTKYLKSKGFESDLDFDNPLYADDAELAHFNNEKLIDEINTFFDSKL